MAFQFFRKKASRAPNQGGMSHYRSHLGRNLLIVLAVLAVLGIGAVICFAPQVITGLLEHIPGVGTEPTTEPLPTDPDQVIHIVAGGDVNITDKTIAAGYSEGAYDYTEVFKDVLPALAQADATVLNFEGILGGSVYGSNTKMAPLELVQALKNAGVDLLQTANSYSIYNGLTGLNATLNGVRSTGMTPLGTFADTKEFETSGGYVIWDIQGIKVAFVAFTKGMDGMGLPAGSENCVNLLYEDYNSVYQKVNTAGITRVMENVAAREPDVIIALLHWGSEYNDQISKSQTKICTLLQELGADAIIGTHSHYVQKMEFDPENGTFVAYSLGDFYGDGEKSGTNYSVLLDLEITKSGADGTTAITGFDCVPIYLDKPEEGKLRVLRIREAIQGYENSYLGAVSQQTYNAMKSALERIQSRTGIE